MTHCKLNPYILRWIEMVESGEIVSCEDQKLLVKYVRQCFETEDIYTDGELLDKYVSMDRYFPFDEVFPWEHFCRALHLATFWRDTGMPRWPDMFILTGRGAGKDGYIALESFDVVSPYSGLREYDVDICANAEEQAMRPVNDVIYVMENNDKKMRKYFDWTKEKVVSLNTRAVIKGRTSNPKSKDGMRSGMVVFNEIHRYENYANIRVYITSLGKKKHPRQLYVTTNGDVRDGPLDELLARSGEILRGEIGDNGLLPFICRLDDKDEAHDEAMWVKANPSLPYRPSLLEIMKKEYLNWKRNPVENAEFMTKRMNLPQSDTEIAITEWENIVSTKEIEVAGVIVKREIPDLHGWTAVAGLDYASIRDWMGANLHFREGDLRYDINHAWMCLQNPDLFRIKAPYKEWAEMGLLTLVDDVEIHPDLACEWLLEQMQKYNVPKLALDHHRYALVAKSLQSIGFDAKERKNIKLVRPSDIMKVHPIIESVFVNHNFIWGDNPVLRWAANNTKLVRSSRKIGSDTGNFYYAKIEAKSRKTDPWMALTHSMVIEDELPENGGGSFYDLPVITA